MQMTMRIGFSILYAVLAAVLLFCAVKSFRSNKSIGKSVGLLDLSFIPPLIGNLIIIVSNQRELSMAGCYIYFLGMDLVMLALVRFTVEYCSGIGRGKIKRTIMYIALTIDAVQLFLNLFFGHAFNIEEIQVQGAPYYRLVPLNGQMFHRLVDYTVFFCVIVIFLVTALRTARIYRERYTVLIIAMILICFWQSFYIISRTPVDRSMVSYGVFGIFVFYLSLYYRPLRLLDNMLSNIASKMTEALFVYAPTGKCIWANETGMNLINIKKDELEEVSPRLRKKFGKRPFSNKDWSDTRTIEADGKTMYYYIENHFVSEDSKHLAGSYLIIRDVTEEQLRVQRELYNSTHDSMTGLYTKQYLYECIRKKLNNETETEFTVIFVDVNNFKIVNDVFGADFGDKAIKDIANWLRKTMMGNCLYGRLAGDTFGAFMPTNHFNDIKDSLEDDLSDFIAFCGNVEHRLMIHMGVYDVTHTGIWTLMLCSTGRILRFLL